MKFLRAFLLFTLPILLIASSSWGYTLRLTESGDVVSWEQDNVVICLDESLSEIGDLKQVGDLIAEAFATWEGSGALPTVFEVVECSSTGDGVSGHDRRNVVSAISGRWPYESHANAVTLVSYDSSTGAIVDVDIIFHAGVDWSLTNIPSENAYDFLDTATHEVGHAIGLEHSEVQRATMYEVTTPGSVRRRTLHDDDISGVTAIYGLLPLGRVASTGCMTTPRAGDSRRLGFFGVALLALVLIGRRSGLRSSPK
jgi:hypothetical protein